MSTQEITKLKNPDREWDSHKIVTKSGLLVDLENPKKEDYNIQDIAHALGMLCRFTGHTNYFYSVAQHSIVVAGLVQRWKGTDEEVKAALLHDAVEAYVGDLSSPLKPLVEGYADVSSNIATAIGERFDTNIEPVPEIVRKADYYALVAEARILFTNTEWTDKVEDMIDEKVKVKNIDYLTSQGQFIFMSPPMAKREFLDNAKHILNDKLNRQ